jgi:hypothetical protein
LFGELSMRLVRQVFEVVGEQQLIVEFACGSSRNAQEPSELLFSIAAATLGDVGGDRCCRLA